MNNPKRRAGAALFALVCAAALLFGLAVIASADDALIYESKDTPPFTVIAQADEPYWTLPVDLTFYKASGKVFYLFLPNAVEPSALKVRYDGKLLAYDEASGKTAAPGETIVCDFSGETAYL